jgi:MFS family permease
LRPSTSDQALLEKPTWQTRLPFYYGWIIVASAFIVLGVGYGVYYSFSVFYVALLEEFGWSRAAAAGVFSVHILVVGLGGAWGGSLIDRFGPSRIVPLGAALLAIALAACSLLTELWQYYLAFGVIGGLGLSMSGWVPAVAVVSAWFSARRGLAIGIASAGIGLVTVVFVPLSQYMISTIGWRSAYLVLAALSLLVSGPVAALTQIGRPEKLGLKADGPSARPDAARSAGPRRKIVVVDPRWASFPWTIGTAVRTHRFWLMTGAIMLTTLTNQMLWAHEAAYLVDSGYEKMLAASVVGLAGLLSMPAKVMWGAASDRYGRERTFITGIATMVTSIALLVAVGRVHFLPLLGLFALTFAFGYAINAPLNPASAGDIFAGRHFGGIFGIMNLGGGMGGALGAWLAGFIFDVTGSYFVAFATAAASSSVSVIFLWLAAPRKVRRVVME